MGDPGRSAVLARRAADGRWFIGGTFTGAAGTVDVPVRLCAARTVDVPVRLCAGRRPAETLTDGPSGPVRETHVVRVGGTPAVPVVADGGFATFACRAPEGRTTCENRPTVAARPAPAPERVGGAARARRPPTARRRIAHTTDPPRGMRHRAPPGGTVTS
ncbi:hypothetical protein ACIOHS_33690 [Streptomyces sp. NPDC088253]|uniref:hypothetical protein n=1 Tax=Streptomyces sp. NPDC088253 TaxID=3365846 RepID=UPI00380181E6